MDAAARASYELACMLAQHPMIAPEQGCRAVGDDQDAQHSLGLTGGVSGVLKHGIGAAEQPAPPAAVQLLNDVLLPPDNNGLGCAAGAPQQPLSRHSSMGSSSSGSASGGDSGSDGSRGAGGMPQTPALVAEPGGCSQPSAEPMMLSPVVEAGLGAAALPPVARQLLGSEAGASTASTPLPPAVGAVPGAPQQGQAAGGGSSTSGSTSGSTKPPPFETSVFFARVPPTVSYDSIMALFQQFGEVVSLNLFRPWATAKTSKGCGIVEFRAEESALAAMAALHNKFHWTGGETTMVCERTDPSRHRKEQDNAKGVFEAKHKTNPARSRPALSRLPHMRARTLAARKQGTFSRHELDVHRPLPVHTARGVAAMLPQLSQSGGSAATPQWWHSLGAAAAAGQAYASLVASVAPLSNLAQVVLQQQAAQGAMASAGGASAVGMPGVSGPTLGHDGAQWAATSAGGSAAAGFRPWFPADAGCSMPPSGLPAAPVAPGRGTAPLLAGASYGSGLAACSTPLGADARQDAFSGAAAPQQQPLNFLGAGMPAGLAAVQGHMVGAGMPYEQPTGAGSSMAALGCAPLIAPALVRVASGPPACATSLYGSAGSTGSALAEAVAAAGEATAAHQPRHWGTGARCHAYASTGSLASMASSGFHTGPLLPPEHMAIVDAACGPAQLACAGSCQPYMQPASAAAPASMNVGAVLGGQAGHLLGGAGGTSAGWAGTGNAPVGWWV